jgi:hypothetical protein
MSITVELAFMSTLKAEVAEVSSGDKSYNCLNSSRFGE